MAIIWMDEHETTGFVVETLVPLPTIAPCNHCNGTGLMQHECLGCDSPTAYYIEGHDVFLCGRCLVPYAKVGR